MKNHNPIITRFKKNPILTRKDVPYPVATVHNAGIVKHNDRYIMLFRSHLLNGRSIIGRADSEDGFSFTVHPRPFLLPSADGIFAEYEAFGVEDLRICPKSSKAACLMVNIFMPGNYMLICDLSYSWTIHLLYFWNSTA